MTPKPRRGFLRQLGPAIIVGSVVLGPGSILTASRTGCDFGYDLVWIAALAAVLMVGVTALSARLGATLDGTICDELARRGGRSLAAFVGIVLFLIVACFQFSNNIGVLAAVTPFADPSGSWPVILLVAVNALVILGLFGLPQLYRPVEILMKALVLLMIVAFLGNMILAKPSLTETVAGLLPNLPPEVTGSLLPRRGSSGIVDPLLPVVALMGTTFSVAGAFFQSYLVRKKGWTEAHLRQGLVDSAVGISILGLVTVMIMVTAASVLHGRVPGSELQSAADVARLLEPLFGPAAKLLFCTGLLAGALSSFLVNAMIGGTVLADGLGLGGDMDGRWARIFTGCALLVGLGVAIAVQSTGERPVNLIIFAQAMTVLGNPVLAGVMLWLSLGCNACPAWLRGLTAAGFVVAVFLAIRTAMRLYLSI